MDADLERRAEELAEKWSGTRADELAQVTKELLSENRQIREETDQAWKMVNQQSLRLEERDERLEAQDKGYAIDVDRLGAVALQHLERARAAEKDRDQAREIAETERARLRADGAAVTYKFPWESTIAWEQR